MGDCDVVVRKGAWTQQEDVLLRNCVEANGEGNWHQVPGKAGLNRCRKSCRLRWLNYLKPNLKRGKFEEDEVDLLVKLHNLLGNRWSMIAKRLPGRTGNDVKNYWNTHLANKFTQPTKNSSKPAAASNNKVVRVHHHHHHQVIRPKARIVKNVVVWQPSIMKPTISPPLSTPTAIPDNNEISSCQYWWETLLEADNNNNNVNDPAYISIIGGDNCDISQENTNIAKGISSSSSFEDSLWIMLSEEEERINQSIWETLGIDDVEM